MRRLPIGRVARDTALTACLALSSTPAAASSLQGVQPTPTLGVEQPTPISSSPKAGDPAALTGDGGPAAAAWDEPRALAQDVEEDDPDLSPELMLPDFYLVNLPTTLRLPRHKLGFRVTHRFTRPLDQGSFADSLGDLFGLDAGAQIGLELRFAPVSGAQVGIYRTSDKTIDFFGSYNVLQSVANLPVSVSANVAVEGTNNFQDSYSPSVGAAATMTFADRLAVTVSPTWVDNTNLLPPGVARADDTVYVGIGARLRLTRRTYLVAEMSPRVSGFRGGQVDLQDGARYVEGKPLAAFGVEGQVGGHVFQVNFSNGFASTPANIARGAAAGRTNWYLGFNISRKFY